MDLVDTIPDVRFWSKILRCSIPTLHLITDREVKVTDLEFFLISEISISHQSVIRKHSSFKYKNLGGSKYRTSSYSSDFVFISFLLQMHFSFIGKALFRRATMFCNSSYYTLWCKMIFPCVGQSRSFHQVYKKLYLVQ